MWTWRRLRASAVAAAAIALASCASVPPARQVPLEAARFALFGRGEVYFAFNMSAGVRSAAEDVLPEGARPLLRRAERLYGAAGRAALAVVAEGRFSPASVRAALALKAGWRRVPGSRDRWRSADGSLEAGSPGAGLLVVGRGDISPVMAAAAAARSDFAMPPAAAAALAGADLFAYAPSLPQERTGGLPIGSAWAAFRQDDGDRFRGDITLLLAGEGGGRLASLAARALVAQLLRDAGVSGYAARLRDIAVQADGPAVRLSGLLLSAGEIAAVARSTGDLLP